MDENQANQNRYQRQVLLPQIGTAGQAVLGRSRVLVLGCGALGTVISEQLVRAGVGLVRIADRDLVELNNLQRQVLFDEEDANQSFPKAIAAAKRLRRVNSSVTIEPLVLDVHAGNIEELLDVDLVMDGTDNAETRYLLNDACVKHGRPWIYGACVGTEGRVMAVVPGKTACLRCVFPEAPGAGELPTCDTVGVLGAIAGAVASIQAATAIRILVDPKEAFVLPSPGVPEEGLLTAIDLWSGRFKTVATQRRQDCPCCTKKQFEFLDRRDGDGAVSLCGRRAVQIRPTGRKFDFGNVVARLEMVGQVQKTAYFARCALSDPQGISLTIFPDGRIIVNGFDDMNRAKSIAARYVGN